MENQSIEGEIRRIAADIAAEAGVEFVHADIVGAKRNLTVRIFIDKPEGVTIEDCTNFSKRLDTILDADDFIPSAYLLEVSSPGLERELYSLSDFERFTGQRVKVKVSEAIEGQKVFVGNIIAVEGGEIVLEAKTGGGSVRFSHDRVVKANLRVDLEKEFKKQH